MYDFSVSLSPCTYIYIHICIYCIHTRNVTAQGDRKFTSQNWLALDEVAFTQTESMEMVFPANTTYRQALEIIHYQSGLFRSRLQHDCSSRQAGVLKKGIDYDLFRTKSAHLLISFQTWRLICQLISLRRTMSVPSAKKYICIYIYI